MPKSDNDKKAEEKCDRIIAVTGSVHAHLSHLKIDLKVSSLSIVIQQLIKKSGYWNPNYNQNKTIDTQSE